MLISAELRWFWRETLPPGLEQWFRSGTLTPGGGNSRDDEYLVDPLQSELGVKKRSGMSGIEIKGLVEVRTVLPGPFSGRVQIWTKWTSHVITIDHLPRIVVRKTRWVRKYDTSGSAVHELELDYPLRRPSRAARRKGKRLPSPRQCLHRIAYRFRIGCLRQIECHLNRPRK